MRSWGKAEGLLETVPAAAAKILEASVRSEGSPSRSDSRSRFSAETEFPDGRMLSKNSRPRLRRLLSEPSVKK